jgi:DNA replication protein DnaC
MAADGYTVEVRDGYAFAVLDPRPPCEWCGGRGRREVVLDGVPRIGRCRCQILPDRAALFNAMRVPARHAHCTFDSFEARTDAQQSILQRVRMQVARIRGNELREGLVLYGNPGLGKTHLAVAAARELIFRHGIEARFVEFSHLLSDIKEGIGRNDPEATTLAPYISPRVLVIDELAKGRNTEFERSILDEIVSRRYNRRGAIIATTNFPRFAKKPEPNDTMPRVETIPERLGDRVYSRLSETLDWIPVIGEDWRTTRR